MKSKILIFPIALTLASSAMAGQFIWTGATNSTWTTASNWDITTVGPVSTDSFPNYGSTYDSDFLNIKNNGDLLTGGSTPGAGAVYDPGAGVTTNFNGGRCFTVGTGTPGTNGAASLEVRSGTIAATRTTNLGSEPYMANRANTLLWLNGGAVDLTGSANNFRLIQEGQLGMTSTLTISSGTLSCNLLDLLFDAETDPTTVFGTGIINLDGGVLAATRFGRTAASSPGQTSFTINLNGGTLRCRNANTNFLPVLADLQVLVKAGGAIIDTATFSSTIAAPLLHDPALGATLDGGLVKSNTGTLTLTGANTYTGGTSVTGGTLAANTASAFGAGAVGLAGGSVLFSTTDAMIVANPINVTSAATITVSGVAVTLSGLTTISANTLFNGTATNGSFVNQITQTGGITSANNSSVDITASNAGNHVFSGVISLGSGSVSRSSGNAAMTLSNASNSFSGGLNLAASPSGNFTGATTITNNGAQGSGPITFTGGSGGISFANVSGTVANNILSTGGSGGVSKTGASNMALTGTNTYIGDITVSGGTLQIGNTNALGFGGVQRTTTGGTIVSSGFTLNLNGTTGINEPITLSGNGISGTGALINNSGTPATISNGIAGVAVAVTGSGAGYSSAPAVVISGTGSGATATASLGVTTASFAINVSGNRSYTVAPTVTISGGTGATATPILSGGTTGTVTGITVTSSGSGFTAAPTAVISGGTSTGTTTSTFLGNATNFTVGGLAMTNAGSGYSGTPTLTFNGSAAAVTPTLSSVSLAANSSIGGAGAVTINAVVSGGFSLTKVGLGTLTLAGTTYTGNTTVSNGTLKLGASGSITTSAAVIITAAGTLDTSLLGTYAIPAAQPLEFGINAAGAGSSGKITAAGLNIANAAVTYNFTGTPDDPVYVLATYTSKTGATFASVPTPPAGYTLDYAYQGNKIALVQATGTTYSTWALTNAPSGTAGDDFDGDGVSNAAEYVLGGTKDTKDLGKLPKVSVSGGNLVFTFERDQATAATTTQIEVGTTLGSWPNTYTVLASTATQAAGVTVVSNPANPGFDTVTLTISQSPDVKKFARLKVTP